MPQGSYLGLLSIRHPNISSSFAFVQFRVEVASNPAATQTANSTADNSTVVLFNPLSNPQIGFTVTFPKLTAATYAGGSSKAMKDFQAVVAAAAALEGPSWVQATVVNASTLTFNTTVRPSLSLAQYP